MRYKLLIYSASVIATFVAFSTGVGAVSVLEKISNNQGKFDNLVLSKDDTLLIDQSAKTAVMRGETIHPPMLKIEIVRNGLVLCQAVETPTVNTSKSFVEYSLNRPITGCPDVIKGDIVKATWTFLNEVEVSSK